MKSLNITGNQASEFLQGQLTCDVTALAEGQSCLGAHCNVKGRVLFNFLLSRHCSGYYLKLPQNMIELAKKRLEKFSVFSKVSVEITAAEGEGLLGSKEDEIKRGFVTLSPLTSGLFTVHELNYPAFQAVSFTKGCYTGQEIVARMQYLGKLKKHLYHATLASPAPPLLGSPIINTLSGLQVGNIADYCPSSGILLIILQDDAVASENKAQGAVVKLAH
ncbi:MAG: folate-binding protein YgfZ [Gammaproteobacteria bacterium]|nr:folate-binding protein YgfZ [Gammaproteobacteria bacterium]